MNDNTKAFSNKGNDNDDKKKPKKKNRNQYSQLKQYEKEMLVGFQYNDSNDYKP